MTKERIEEAHDALCAAVAMNLDMSKHWCEQKWEQAHALRDLALQSLSQTENALQSPARVAEGAHKCTSDKIIRGYQDGYDIGWCGVCGTITWGSDGLIGNELTSRRDHSLWKEKNLIAWSCSREARGKDKCKEWCGHQRYCTAVTKKWSSPESPAKEQPGEQNAAPQAGSVPLTGQVRGLGSSSAVAAPDAAANGEAAAQENAHDMSNRPERLHHPYGR